ncbi:hypothetical protein C5167_018210 [Papaver somniferum]|uniref:Uncharacterized protein n=1 Tax=Papaver somniferum TaxID=3469 RepID=A0A4Y7ILM0_PAPSO|nr:hypothetical protein C5167_018210 [Papaver somniferum]
MWIYNVMVRILWSQTHNGNPYWLSDSSQGDRNFKDSAKGHPISVVCMRLSKHRGRPALERFAGLKAIRWDEELI